VKLELQDQRLLEAAEGWLGLDVFDRMAGVQSRLVALLTALAFSPLSVFGQYVTNHSPRIIYICKDCYTAPTNQPPPTEPYIYLQVDGWNTYVSSNTYHVSCGYSDTFVTSNRFLVSIEQTVMYIDYSTNLLDWRYSGVRLYSHQSCEAIFNIDESRHVLIGTPNDGTYGSGIIPFYGAIYFRGRVERYP